jgi:hypothetical protein
LTQILEAKQESVNLVKEVKFQRTSGEDRMKSSCDCWLEAKRWMAKDLETLPSPFSNALNSSLKLFLPPFPSRSQMFPGSISELCAVSHTLGCSWMGLLHQRNFCNFSKNTVQVLVWHQRSSSAFYWVQIRGAVPKNHWGLQTPVALSLSVRRPSQITGVFSFRSQTTANYGTRHCESVIAIGIKNTLISSIRQHPRKCGKAQSVRFSMPTWRSVAPGLFAFRVFKRLYITLSSLTCGSQESSSHVFFSRGCPQSQQYSPSLVSSLGQVFYTRLLP